MNTMTPIRPITPSHPLAASQNPPPKPPSPRPIPQSKAPTFDHQGAIEKLEKLPLIFPQPKGTRPMSRPHVLTEKKKSQILALLKTGCGKRTAAHAVNCHPETIANTAKRDPIFAQKLALAENAAQLIHLENVNKAGSDVKYWRASAWVLERLNPDQFGKSEPDTVTPPQLSALILQIADVIVQEIPVARYRTQILKRFDEILREANLPQIAIPIPQEQSSQPESPLAAQ